MLHRHYGMVNFVGTFDVRRTSEEDLVQHWTQATFIIVHRNLELILKPRDWNIINRLFNCF